MSMALKRDELKKLSIKDLEKKHDEVAEHTMVGINYFTEEITRRKQHRFNNINILLSIGSLIVAIVAIVVAFIR